MPLYTEEKKALKIVDALRELATSRFKLFIRSDGMRLYGLLTKIEYRYDTEYGEVIPWAMGITVDGKVFEEPLVYKNQRTGKLENCIQIENNFLLVTSRKTNDPTDNPDNFVPFISPHEAQYLFEMKERAESLERALEDMKQNMESIKRQRDAFRREAEVTKSALKGADEQINALSHENVLLRQRVTYLEGKVKELEAVKIQTMAMQDKMLEKAGETGTILAMDTDELVDRAIEKATEREKKLQMYRKEEPSTAILSKVAERLDEIERTLKEGKKAQGKAELERISPGE